MRKPLTTSQCVVLALFWAALCFIVLTSSPQIDGMLILALFWAALCFIVLTSSPQIDGMLILTILISGALVFIPIVKALKKGRNK